MEYNQYHFALYGCLQQLYRVYDGEAIGVSENSSNKYRNSMHDDRRNKLGMNLDMRRGKYIYNIFD